MKITQNKEKYFKFIIYLVVIVLINIVGLTLFFRLDLTQNKIYSISDASKKVVSTLSEPLTIKVFFSKNLPAPHNNTERYLHDLLNEYSIYGNKYFNFQFYDVSSDEDEVVKKEKENKEIAQNYGIYPVQVQNIEKDEVKFLKAYMGMVIIHGDLIEKIPTITTTDGLEYQLTTTIQKMNNKISALLGVKDKIQAKLFMSSTLKEVAPYMRLNQLQNLSTKLEEVIQKANQKNYDRLEYKFFDPTNDSQAAQESEKYNLLTLQWPDIPKANITSGKGSIGLVLELGKKFVEIQLIKVVRLPIFGTQYNMVDLDSLDEIISKNLESLIDINQSIGYLADHGTLTGGDGPNANPLSQQRIGTISNFRNLISKNYSIRDINLKDDGIPDDIKCLVVAQPTETFTDYELYLIDQFLMKGKSLALFIDSFKEMQTGNQQMMQQFNQPTFVPVNTGLEKLIAHYGVRVKNTYVLDESCYRQNLGQRAGGGERPIYFAPIIKNKFVNKEFDYMKNVKGLVLMKASPLEIAQDHVDSQNLKVHKLFASTEKSWEMKGRINLNPMFIRPPTSDDERSSQPLAYVVEGNFISYFSKKPIPEQKFADDKPAEQKDGKDTEEKKDTSKKVDLSKFEEKGQTIENGKPGKIFVIGTSEILKNNMIDEGGRTPNALFLMNQIDFLNNNSDTAVMRSKEQKFNPLDDTLAGTKAFVKSFNIIGLPILVVIFGGIVYFVRQSRKKRIQMMFQR